MTPGNQFKTSLLDPGEFTITYELVPGQGAWGKRVDSLLAFADRARADGRIKALSITDNPGGVPALAPVAMGSEIRAMGMEPLIHFSLKDKNRNQVESHIFLYQRMQLHSLLVLGGDFPRQGYYGQARPVYDLDSIQALQLMRDMETGCYHYGTREHAPASTPPLFKGCVVSPFKTTEAEQVWQYAKLLRKVRAGADFIITQLGFDPVKPAEMMHFCTDCNIDLPVLANIFIPSLAVARAMAAGRVPGVAVSGKLIQAMEQEATRGDTRARLDRAVAMILTARKLGYQGVHIGGNGLAFEDLRYIMDQITEKPAVRRPAGNDDDFAIDGTWYFYGRNNDAPVPLAPGRRPGAVRIHRLTHDLLFSQQTFSGRLFKKLCLLAAKKESRTRILLFAERWIKRLLFNCRMCGDCTLAHSAYLCPQSGCPKRLVNGPCGGSLHGSCEVFPNRRCFWVRVYDRLDPGTTFDSLTDRPALPPKNWALERTSSWINYFSGLDRQQEK
jgi:methylenetetrahydrofolate reductase (NADPH)